MLINKIAQTMQGELRKVDGTRARIESEREQPKAKAGDRSEFSADGKLRSETTGEVQIISSMLKAQPDIRADRVAEAQAKINAGFYNTASFAEKLAEKLAPVLA